jgi:DNA-binding XRE family transcriptional regulator
MPLTKHFRFSEKPVQAFPRSFRFLPFVILVDGEQTPGVVLEGMDILGNPFGIGEGEGMEEAVEALCWSVLDALLAGARKGEDYRKDLWTAASLINRLDMEQRHFIPFSPELLFPVALRLARVQANLTQTALAEIMRVSQQAIQKLETPGVNPKLETVAELSMALGHELVGASA